MESRNRWQGMEEVCTTRHGKPGGTSALPSPRRRPATAQQAKAVRPVPRGVHGSTQ
jgi:hypothetical protein